ncbi:MAG TPA: saccharopine dehydrogenase C-terminal domain-containing protein, partial [Saprospiraceae bacterium]|nr:saccharopine dehydrogenase C-terminal domain-containing protein [Saprospiraceae bacterium]
SEDIKIDTDLYSIREIFAMFFQSMDSSVNIQEIIQRSTGKLINKETADMFLWLDPLSEIKLKMSYLTPAEILEELLIRKWKLNDADKDMVIMQHIFEYSLNGHNYQLRSTLKDIGINSTKTSMARLVGLPLAIYVKNYLLGRIKDIGFKIPVEKQFYEPILNELKDEGIWFSEVITEINS